MIFTMSKLKSLDKLQDWLDQYLNFEKTPQKNIFWLETMNFFCRKFSQPQDFAPSFHVAGSKGKGSVSTFIASILEAAGFRTGLYTSPHLLDFAERITRNHEFFSDSVYEKAAEELMEGIKSISKEELPGERPITWFELVTLFGFLVFRQAKVDYSIFEVGLGGRLDSTNVIKPKISIITPIELEHTEFLGDTVEKIAAEKGGIIKENIPVIISSQKESVKEVFRKIAEEKNSKIYFMDNLVENLKFKYPKDSIKNNTLNENKCAKNYTGYDNFKKRMHIEFESELFSRKISTDLKLLGEVQANNAALAACAVKLVLPEITETQIEEGLENAFLPGRFEITESKIYPQIPAIILDGAHTVNSCGFTMKTLEDAFYNDEANKSVLLFGCAEDKDSKDIALLFRNKFQKVFLTIPGLVKKSNLQAVEESFVSAGISFDSDKDFYAQIKKALEYSNANKRTLLVTGSFYLLSEVKKVLSES